MEEFIKKIEEIESLIEELKRSYDKNEVELLYKLIKVKQKQLLIWLEFEKTNNELGLLDGRN